MFYNVVTVVLLCASALILLGYARYEKKQAEIGREKIFAAAEAVAAHPAERESEVRDE